MYSKYKKPQTEPNVPYPNNFLEANSARQQAIIIRVYLEMKLQEKQKYWFYFYISGLGYIVVPLYCVLILCGDSYIQICCDLHSKTNFCYIYSRTCDEFLIQYCRHIKHDMSFACALSVSVIYIGTCDKHKLYSYISIYGGMGAQKRLFVPSMQCSLQ